MNEWIRRKRNSHGFGIQSPNDFFFVQHVLREKSPYYAYKGLHEIANMFQAYQPCLPDNINRLLFRLVNHTHPNTIIEVGTGSGLSTYAMAMAHPCGHCITISNNPHIPAWREADALLGNDSLSNSITYRNGNEITLFTELLHELRSIEFLHIAHTPHYQEIVEIALPYVSDNTLFVIEGIRNNKDKYLWWKKLTDNNLTKVSYDIGSIGLLFFNTTRFKINYWINLND